MAAGDIWLRTNNYVGHYDPSGTLIFERNIPFAELGSIFQSDSANLVHNGTDLWLAQGGSTYVYRADPATLTILDTYQFTDGGEGWARSVAVEASGRVVVLGSSAIVLLELAPDGSVAQSYFDYSFPEVSDSRIAIAPGSDVVFLFDLGYDLIARATVASGFSDEFTLSPPGGYTSAFPASIAPKSDGGYWVSWSADEAAALFVEYDSGGSVICVVPMPMVASPYYDYFTGAIDVDANDNLLVWVPIDTDVDSYSKLLRIAKTTGAVTVLNAHVSDSYGFGTTFSSNYLHVERTFGPSTPPWLRQMQRDDVTRQYARNGPTSVQASIRQGPAGTYL